MEQPDLFSVPRVLSPDLIQKQRVKEETLQSKRIRVVKAWNSYATDPDVGWIRVKKLPGGETGRALEARIKNESWMKDFERALAVLAKLDWYRTPKKGESEPRKMRILTFLREDSVRAILGGEWGDTKPKDVGKALTVEDTKHD